jgi:hypothetical protein
LGRKKVSKNKKGNRAGGNRYHARYIKPLGWQKPIHVLFGLNEKSDKEGAGGCVGDGGESQFVCDSKIEESDNTVKQAQVRIVVHIPLVRPLGCGGRDGLEEDLQSKIMEYLPWEDLRSLAFTCTHLRKVVPKVVSLGLNHHIG